MLPPGGESAEPHNAVKVHFGFKLFLEIFFLAIPKSASFDKNLTLFAINSNYSSLWYTNCAAYNWCKIIIWRVFPHSLTASGKSFWTPHAFVMYCTVRWTFKCSSFTHVQQVHYSTHPEMQEQEWSFLLHKIAIHLCKNTTNMNCAFNDNNWDQVKTEGHQNTLSAAVCPGQCLFALFAAVCHFHTQDNIPSGQSSSSLRPGCRLSCCTTLLKRLSVLAWLKDSFKHTFAHKQSRQDQTCTKYFISYLSPWYI